MSEATAASAGAASAATVLRGRVVTGRTLIEDGYVEVAEGEITAVGPVTDLASPPPAGGGTLLPGLVDVHCHGGGGAAITSGDPEELVRVVDHHASAGTTRLVASTVTDAPDRMLAVVAAAAALADRGGLEAIHLEGPFLAHERRGAQDPRHLRDPDLALAGELIDAGRGHVRVMTVAPELPGADGLLELLADRGVVAAVGHTDGDVDAAARALARSGVDLVTHLFNGMPPLHHRSPGPVAAALEAASQGETRVELVADGVHLADATVRMVFDLLAPDRVVLVTDAMAAAGMPDGDYELGSQRVTVAGGVARLGGDGQQSIAGGTARLLEVVARCVRDAGVDLLRAVRAATVNPAEALGHGDVAGELAPGRRADVVEVDDELGLRRVMRAGEWLT